MKEDAHEELIATNVNADVVVRNNKKSKLKEELWRIDTLEIKVAGIIRFKTQQEIWDKSLNDHREIVIECKEK